MQRNSSTHKFRPLPQSQFLLFILIFCCCYVFFFLLGMAEGGTISILPPRHRRIFPRHTPRTFTVTNTASKTHSPHQPLDTFPHTTTIHNVPTTQVTTPHWNGAPNTNTNCKMVNGHRAQRSCSPGSAKGRSSFRKRQFAQARPFLDSDDRRGRNHQDSPYDPA